MGEKNEDIKLIDWREVIDDSCYFDLELKFFQSIVSNYKEWNDLKL